MNEMSRRYEMLLLVYGEDEERRAEKPIRYNVSAVDEESARRETVHHARCQGLYVSEFVSIAVKDLA